MEVRFDTITGLVSTVAGIIGILALWGTNPYLAGASLLLFLAGLLWLLYHRHHRSFREVRRGLSIICRELRRKNYQPNLIIAFNRTGTVVAGMLAVNLAVQEVIGVSRRRKRTNNSQFTKKLEFDVGSLMKLDAE